MESKVIRLLSIIHNGIILDLACGFFGGSVGEDVRADFSSVSERNLFLFMVEAVARDLMNQRERW